MTPLKLVVALGALSAASHALAWDYVLLDKAKRLPKTGRSPASNSA